MFVHSYPLLCETWVANFIYTRDALPAWCTGAIIITHNNDTAVHETMERMVIGMDTPHAANGEWDGHSSWSEWYGHSSWSEWYGYSLMERSEWYGYSLMRREWYGHSLMERML